MLTTTAVFLAWFLASGCGSHPDLADLTTVTVTGRVTLNGKPIDFGSGRVEFEPVWTEQQPSCPIRVSGTIDRRGRYKLYTHVARFERYLDLVGMKEGAPPGLYRVSIEVREEFDEAVHHRRNRNARSQALLSPVRYTDAQTSGIRVKVTEDAATGHYDLRLAW